MEVRLEVISVYLSDMTSLLSLYFIMKWAFRGILLWSGSSLFPPLFKFIEVNLNQAV